MEMTADMSSRVLQEAPDVHQLGLYEGAPRRTRPKRRFDPVCAGCRAREARYGFRDERYIERPRTLCFACFRIEVSRLEQVAARLARSWNAEQVGLPLAGLLEEADRRRRRAQIAARHAVGE
jgi:hypothetical protein